MGFTFKKNLLKQSDLPDGWYLHSLIDYVQAKRELFGPINIKAAAQQVIKLYTDPDKPAGPTPPELLHPPLSREDKFGQFLLNGPHSSVAPTRRARNSGHARLIRAGVVKGMEQSPPKGKQPRRRPRGRAAAAHKGQRPQRASPRAHKSQPSSPPSQEQELEQLQSLKISSPSSIATPAPEDTAGVATRTRSAAKCNLSFE